MIPEFWHHSSWSKQQVYLIWSLLEISVCLRKVLMWLEVHTSLGDTVKNKRLRLVKSITLCFPSVKSIPRFPKGKWVRKSSSSVCLELDAPLLTDAGGQAQIWVHTLGTVMRDSYVCALSFRVAVGETEDVQDARMYVTHTRALCLAAGEAMSAAAGCYGFEGMKSCHILLCSFIW